MTQFAPIRPVDIEGPDLRWLEGRASLALKVLAGIKLLGVVFSTFRPDVPVPLLHVVAFNIAALALATVYVVEARGLDKRRPWARGAVRPMLGIIAAVSLYGFAASVASEADGLLRLPFDAVLVVWAWLRGPEPPALPRPNLRGAAVVFAALPLYGAILFGGGLFAWGGPLDVQPTDLDPALVVTCGEPGHVGAPDTIDVAYDWSWSGKGILPSGVDVIVVGWTATDATGRPLYGLDSMPQPAGKGLRPGYRDYPSKAMADAIGLESGSALYWGFDLTVQRLQPVHIDVGLVRSAATAPEHGTVRIALTYVHDGVWRRDLTDTSCSW